MEFFIDYLYSSIVGFSLELLAAITGSYYLIKLNHKSKRDKYLVYFLWFNFILEIVASYSPIGYYSKYEYFSFVKDTSFANNMWLYNIYFLINYSFFIYYFRSFLHNNIERFILKISIFLFLILGSINLVISDVFFKEYSLFSTVLGSLLVLMAIVLFYFNILKSNKIINLKRYLPIYISIGVLIFNLCITPLDIYSQYFNEKNGLFIKVKTYVLVFSSLFMYSTFILGFLISDKKNSIQTEPN